MPDLQPAGSQHLPHEGVLTPTDAELLRRSAGGDRQAFDIVVERHAPAVLRFLGHMGLDFDQAQDVAQETLVAAWRHAGTFQSEDARAWILAIARNASRRHFRRRVGEPRDPLPLDSLAVEAGWGAARDDDLLGRIAVRDALERAFARLTPGEREILSLRDIEGYGGAEAAEVLGISLAAQKSRLHRARLRLMTELKGEDSDAR